MVERESYAKSTLDGFRHMANALEDLHQTIDKCQETAFVSSNAKNLSAISRLPTDILTLIFRIALDLQHNYSNGSPKESRLGAIPLVASHVCATWRDLTVNSPLLWITINITYPWSLDLVCLWLARSKSCPIDLYVTATMKAPSSELGPIDGILQRSNVIPGALSILLAHHLPRCRIISINTSETFAPIADAFQDCFCQILTPLVLLEEFAFQNYGSIFGSSGQTRVLFPGGVPALTKLKVGRPFSLLTLHTITFLHVLVNSVAVAEFHTMVSQCLALETLAIYESFSNRFSDLPPLPPLRLPFLSSLQLYDTGFISRILMWITAPFLQHLVIAPFSLHDLDGLHKVAKTARDFSSIKSVALSVIGADPNDRTLPLARAFDCFPNVEDVILAGESVSAAIKSLAAVNKYTGWPNLHTLSARGIGRYIASDKLEAAVSLRYLAGFPVSRVCLDRESLEKMNATRLVWLKAYVDVVEQDSWDILRQDRMYQLHPDYDGEDNDE